MQSSDQSNIQLEEVLFGLASLSSDQSNIQLEEVLFGLASLSILLSTFIISAEC
jgi:hypothetical protein